MLPKPSLEAQQHSEKTKQYILDEINRSGPITFARYMELALYAPGLGYYNAGNQKFGKAGDFITAPEVSSLFSDCLACWCQENLKKFKNGGILELGAGSGKMACDILLSLEKQGALPSFYWILDLSADLKARQKLYIQEKAPHLFDRVKWLSSLPKKESFEGVILANEVVDAMPVHRFKKDKTVQEFFVKNNQGEFDWTLKEPHSSQLLEAVEVLGLQEEDCISEINLMLLPWLSGLFQSLKKGALLIIDYGYSESEYYRPERLDGTLACYYQHRMHTNPLIFPGIQDITAHVNFTALEKAGIKAGFNVSSYQNQASFLLECGLEEILRIVLEKEGNSVEQFQLTSQAKKLLLPNEMGELFKVMVFEK